MGKVGEIENACFLVFRALPATAVPQASKSGNMWAARDRRLGPRPKKGYARVLASTAAQNMRLSWAREMSCAAPPPSSGRRTNHIFASQRWHHRAHRPSWKATSE